MIAEVDQRSDPSNNTNKVIVFWALRGCELLWTLIFSTAASWERPFAWFVLVAGFASWRWWYLRRPAFHDLPLRDRRQIYRVCVWTSMFLVGSAWYFLYVPGNFFMHVMLAIYLLGSAVMVALRVTGDFARTVGAVSLSVLPTSFRFIYEGAQGNTLLVFLGVGGVLITISILLMSRGQERALLKQHTLRKRAERAANAAADEGLAKSRFFAAVSHDLRQPVHAIGLYLDPLIQLSHQTRDVTAQRAAEGIRQSWRALDDLLSQLLDLTRMDSGAVRAELRPVEMASIVRNLVMQHSAVAESAGVRIVALVKTGCFALADDLMLKRVLSNLLDNAIKFSPPGATVVVALRSRQDQWNLQVRDAGIGIPPEAQSRIFDEFVQLQNDARDRQRGLGLGLAISKRFMVLMNGDLLVRSESGRGCCMAMSLAKVSPAAQCSASAGTQDLRIRPTTGAAHEDAEPPPLLPVFTPRNGPMPNVQAVLLVEDDDLVAQAMCHLLQGWGLRVRHVHTAADALRESAYGQLAICDVRLPQGESGLDVALRLRAGGKKVLLLTGETTDRLRRAANRNAVPLLIKPVSSAELLSTLQAL